MSNSDHIELPALVLTSTLTFFYNSTLLKAAASSFPTLTAVSCYSISQQKLGRGDVGGGDILIYGALAGIWQVVKSTIASIGLGKKI